MYKLTLTLCALMVFCAVITSGKLIVKQIPADASKCPAKYNPPKFKCMLRLLNPTPVCQYLIHGKTRQAYNYGCDYMCDKNVLAIRTGYCNGSDYTPTPITSPIATPVPAPEPVTPPVATPPYPSNATVCPANHKPSLIHCDVVLANPIPVCQYLKDGTKRQAYNEGCDDMCDEDVVAYINGNCESTDQPQPVQVPDNATVCPPGHVPSLIHCNVYLLQPIPICQYMDDGTTNQAYNTGCDDMCQKGVKAYIRGNCNGSTIEPAPIRGPVDIMDNATSVSVPMAEASPMMTAQSVNAEAVSASKSDPSDATL